MEIAIDPGHAFGHGGHPSTRLVLAALVERLRGGESVLDVGCGSGVLSLAAVALGAESARAIDIDPTAVAVTRANAVANRLSQPNRRRFDATGSDSTSIRRRGRQHRRRGAARAGRRAGRRGSPPVAGWCCSGLLEHQWREVVDLALAAADGAAGDLRLDVVARDEGWAAPILTVGQPSRPAAPEVAPGACDA